MDHAHKIAHDANAERSGIQPIKPGKVLGKRPKTPENAGKRLRNTEKHLKCRKMYWHCR